MQRTIYSLWIFFTSLTLSAPAFAAISAPTPDPAFAPSAPAKVTLEITLKEATAVYQRTNPSDEYMEITSAYSVSDLKVSGNSWLFSLNTVNKNLIDKKVPGADYDGHAHLELEQGDDNLFYIFYDGLINTKIEGLKILTKWTYRVPVKFLKGSWEGYEAGEQVEITSTEEGEKIEQDMIISQLKSMFQQGAQKRFIQTLLKGLNSQKQPSTTTPQIKLKVGDIILEEYSGESYLLTGNKDQLEARKKGSEPIVIKLSFTVTMISDK